MRKSRKSSHNRWAWGTLFLLLTVPAWAQPANDSFPKEFTDPVVGLEFVFIKGGPFEMGDLIGDSEEGEVPIHTVTVRDFYMGKYEVSFAQYDKFCEITGKPKPSDKGYGRGKIPALNISWQDALEFAVWLTEKTGRKFRLPTEAEWEYAARAGTRTNYWWGNALGKNNANCTDCGSQWDKKSPAPVGSFKPNPWGLYDTVGNVWEWTMDNFHETYEGAPADGNAWYDADTNWKTYRGGAFQDRGFYARVSTRWGDVSRALKVRGFRLVMEVPSPPPLQPTAATLPAQKQ